jgi:hypothetical protein
MSIIGGDILFCRKCGRTIPDDSVFCSYCGESVSLTEAETAPTEQLEEKEHGYCSNCGEPLPPGKLAGICNTCFEQIGYDPYTYGKCEGCGSPLGPDDGALCKSCAGKLVNPTKSFYTPGPVKSELYYDDATWNQKKKGHGCLISVLVCIGLLALIAIMGSMSTPTAGNNITSSDIAQESSVSTVASSTPLSTRQENILSAFNDSIKSAVEDTIKKQLKHPDTAIITHDTSQLTADNAIFTDRGSVSYTNVKGKSVKEDFTVSIISTDKVYYSLYMQLGKTVFLDCSKGTNSLGIATSYGEELFGVADGNSLFDDLNSGIIMITDEESQKITMSEFGKINTGKTYAQVTEIIGSYGTEQAQSKLSGYETVIMDWTGNGSAGSNASVTFLNGKVVGKAQVGLQ